MNKGKLLITGASGALAQVCIPMAQAQGWEVLAVSRAVQPTTATMDTRWWRADVSQMDEVDGLFKALQGEDAVPDALLHLAGSFLLAGLGQTSELQYRQCLSANLDSAFFTLRAFVAARRRAGGGGAAVFVSSVVAEIGVAFHEAVAAAKGGLEAMVRAAAATHARDGIRINAVASGLMDSRAAAHLLRNPQSRELAAKQYPLGGLIPPEQVARMLLTLVDPDNGQITGQILPVDGGFTAIRPLVTGS
ncbi:SDR family oxidoreductase [Acidithiobacillus sp.]|uniref:SDR family oxidoreductase n=1 Tax=Acidithiobacillus sp. TaxID=1872118 RepID=UPI0025BC2431|nr:SDR family oxidoreductase [Acidithiobacillus sp.]